MESLFLPWNESGTWRVQRSYVTGEGQVVVIELAETEGAQATLTAHLGPASGDLASVWQQLGQGASPELWQSAETPARRLFAMPPSHVGILVEGEKGRYMVLLEAEPAQLSRWGDFLWQARLQPQALWQSLQAAGLAVFSGLEARKEPPPLAPPAEAGWEEDPRLRGLMHPAQPGEVLVRVPSPDSGWQRAWVRLLEARPDYWLGQRIAAGAADAAEVI
ncbi:MAG: hypothetical protein D6722_13040, partial [Bacteroidetes bacterium]